MGSNVTLKSNIYINKTASTGDQDFLKHITDYRILRRYGSGSENWRVSGWMTPTQRAILGHGQPNCSLERGTMSWGVPVGSERFVCRCEQYTCSMFNKICSQYSNFESVERDGADHPKAVPAAVNVETLPLYDAPVPAMEPIESIVEDTEIPITPDVSGEKMEPISIDVMKAEEPKEEVSPIKEPVVVPAITNTVQITEQATIINASISERIWVNAGPGTGKTYTVIQRLKKLLSSELDGAILVLCFSKNAVQVIYDRLQEAIGYQADALISDGQLVIRTFDSFATYMLEDELNPAWDYNKRIEEFIKMIGRNSGALNDMLEYLIVDEIQDTVGVRARMLISMLDELTCGVLLLGDKCQSIFDWTIRDTNDMTFVAMEKELEKRGFTRYELAENRRQAKELAQKGQELRQVMLLDDEDAQQSAVQAFKAWTKTKWRGYEIKSLPQCLSGAEDLVLCKTNGEAARISQLLYENGAHFSHMMKQSSNHKSLASWIAKALHGNDGHILAKAQYDMNVSEYEIPDADAKWKTLKSLDGHEHAPGLHIPEVLSALSQMDSLPDICLNTVDDAAIISTVHRAKGSEAEHVYWIDSPLVYENQQEQEGALSDSLKAAYVAATRAKKDIHMVEPDGQFYMKSVLDNRWIRTGYSKSKKPFCKGIAMLPGDVDLMSFASVECADASQTLLSCLEAGFPVELYPNEAEYCFDIYFEGQPIGKTSSDFTKALFAGFDATNKNKNWPAGIRNVFISAVTTVVAPGAGNVDERYRTSGCWLGIELGGFPNLEWY